MDEMNPSVNTGAAIIQPTIMPAVPAGIPIAIAAQMPTGMPTPVGIPTGMAVMTSPMGTSPMQPSQEEVAADSGEDDVAIGEMQDMYETGRDLERRVAFWSW